MILAVSLVAFCAYLGVSWQPPPEPPLATPEELFQRGLQGIRTRQVMDVRSALHGLESNAGSAEQVSLLRGALSLLTENPQAALEDFSKLSPDGPLRDPLLTLTGEALYRVGRLDDAERCLSMAIRQTPDQVDALRWLATVYYDLGDIDSTLRTLGEVSRVAPQDYRPHHMQGAIYRDFGEHQKAITALQRALELAGQAEVQREIRPLLASSQMSLKQYDAAIRTLQEGPATTTTLALQADCLWQSGQLDTAREVLQQAESLGSLPASGQRLKARISIESGQLPEARLWLESLIASDPGDDEAEYLLALLFRQLKDETAYQAHLARSESIKTLKHQLTALSEKAMKEAANAEVRDQLADLCDQLGLKPLAEVWRTAAASCRRRLPPAVPSQEANP